MPSTRAPNPEPRTPPPHSAFSSRDAWAWMLVACVLSVGIDLWSKAAAFEHVAGAPVVLMREQVMAVAQAHGARAISQPEFGIMPRHDPVTLIPRVLDLQLVLNPGAVFGIGPGQRFFFIGFTVLALAFGVLMFARWTTARDHGAHVAIGLLIGGGLGNLYDRLQFACVRDFLHPLPGLMWPGTMTVMGNREVWPYVSNLADLFLLIGIFMLLIHLWKRDKAAASARS